MDPYLERPDIWPDVHQSLITYIRDALQPDVRPQYHARISERLYVVESFHTIYPDVTLVQRPQRSKAGAGAATTETTMLAVADEPIVINIPPARLREPFIEIVHIAGGEVVTVIEVISPSNKMPGEGRRMYLQKQQEVRRSRANLVEIDLLSQGRPTVAPPRDSLATLPPWRYLVSVSRAPNHERFEVYPIPLIARLPRFRVPLRGSDPDVVLDLQVVLGQAYENGGYADFLDYTQPPPVHLSEEETSWLAERLAPFRAGESA
jgi:hypothetical protein